LTLCTLLSSQGSDAPNLRPRCQTALRLSFWGNFSKLPAPAFPVKSRPTSHSRTPKHTETPHNLNQQQPAGEKNQPTPPAHQTPTGATDQQTIKPGPTRSRKALRLSAPSGYVKTLRPPTPPVKTPTTPGVSPPPNPTPPPRKCTFRPYRSAITAKSALSRGT
jgi:hypothetical protein